MMHSYTHLSRRSIVKIFGKDAGTFLQGLVSNDMMTLEPGMVRYACLLSPQGRFLHDFLIFKSTDSYFLSSETNRTDDLITRLKKYKLRADVTFEAIPDLTLTAWDEYPTALEQYPHAPDPRHAELGIVALIPAQELSGYTPLSFADYETKRISLCIPDGATDMIEGDSLLLDYGIDRINGISWTKGCYVGQEVTARMHYRALVKKQLTVLKLQQGSFPAKGTALFDAGVEIGVMGGNNGTLGLALLRRDNPPVVIEIKDGSLLGVYST
jgi:tRNA-modifying protein YgfZ